MNKLQGLYAITDDKLIAPDQFSTTIKKILQGGASIIQYRDKSNNKNLRVTQANELRLLCNQYNALFIINDDITLAKKVGADGVHLGKNDNSVSDARNELGKKAIIGVSCYNRLELAQQAENEGADYVAFGAFFPSTIKPEACVANIELLIQAKQRLSIPVCAIGGITIDNVTSLIDAGADMTAVISGLLTQSDIASSAQEFSNLF